MNDTAPTPEPASAGPLPDAALAPNPPSASSSPSSAPDPAAPSVAPAGGETPDGDAASAATATGDAGTDAATAPRRRRGSRGGRNRRKSPAATGDPSSEPDQTSDPSSDPSSEVSAAPTGATSAPTSTKPSANGQDRNPEELPKPPSEGRVADPQVAAEALVRKPRIGDTRPAPPTASAAVVDEAEGTEAAPAKSSSNRRRRRGSGGKGSRSSAAVVVALDPEIVERRKGRERKGRPVGRYLMCVHVRDNRVQLAVLEGRSLIEHYVSLPSDDVYQIHGNIYVGRVQNVLPGMEAAFIDIGTPKNAVLYRGDVQYDREDLLDPAGTSGVPRIEDVLKPRQLILCQVTKNPIGAKGARLTQEVSLPGRFVVLIPNSRTYGISKRLPDDERRRLRTVLDKVKPDEHGLIVRTAAEHASEQELSGDVRRLVAEWEAIARRAAKATSPTLVHREPGLAVRVIREEFNADYRGIVLDDPELHAEVLDYVGSISPELVDRVELYDPAEHGLPLFERHHVHEQLHKALERKVWLPSGGSLIIEHTEALTVIDVNTGKNVGSSSLEHTVLHNNLEAADEIARQLRLRDIGGIIVIDFIDMEAKENRQKVVQAFRDALARDKTRTQVFDISELGLVEMTRKRIGEGLLESFADVCPHCNGRGVSVDHGLID